MIMFWYEGQNRKVLGHHLKPDSDSADVM